MKQYITVRVLEVADFLIESNSTVRDAGKKFCLSKSTVHKDMQERLKVVDKNRWQLVQKVLKQNLSERHIRGGIATKNKFKK